MEKLRHWCIRLDEVIGNLTVGINAGRAAGYLKAGELKDAQDMLQSAVDTYEEHCYPLEPINVPIRERGPKNPNTVTIQTPSTASPPTITGDPGSGGGLDASGIGTSASTFLENLTGIDLTPTIGPKLLSEPDQSNVLPVDHDLDQRAVRGGRAGVAGGGRR